MDTFGARQVDDGLFEIADCALCRRLQQALAYKVDAAAEAPQGREKRVDGGTEMDAGIVLLSAAAVIP